MLHGILPRVLLYDRRNGKGKPHQETSGNLTFRQLGGKTCGYCPRQCNKSAYESRSAGNPVRNFVWRHGCVDGSFWQKPGEIQNAPAASVFQPVRAVGILAANVTISAAPAVSGAIVGFLISLPEAIAMKSYAGILGTGLVFGALTGLAVKLWVT